MRDLKDLMDGVWKDLYGEDAGQAPEAPAGDAGRNPEPPAGDAGQDPEVSAGPADPLAGKDLSDAAGERSRELMDLWKRVSSLTQGFPSEEILQQISGNMLDFSDAGLTEKEQEALKKRMGSLFSAQTPEEKELYRLFGEMNPGLDLEAFGLNTEGKDGDAGSGTGFSAAGTGAGASGLSMPDRTEGPSVSAADSGKSGQKEEKEAVQKEQDAQKEERSGYEELEELIGLESIKADVKELTDLVRTQKMREDMGMKTVPVSLHLVFSGNPGTGKTTVARILARLYKEIGVLSKGQLVETDRSGLVAGYVGQTALKTQEKIQEALGGILFIDEAYTLAKEGQDYGQEAIDTILKAMEDHRKDLVVIVAGYTEPMKRFIESNPGLESRFNKYFYFEDYTKEELLGIFNLQCKKYDYELSPQARERIEEGITWMEAHKGENFANAREIRNLFETIITNQARRIARMDNPSAADLRTILPEDLEEDGTLPTIDRTDGTDGTALSSSDTCDPDSKDSQAVIEP